MSAKLARDLRLVLHNTAINILRRFKEKTVFLNLTKTNPTLATYRVTISYFVLKTWFFINTPLNNNSKKIFDFEYRKLVTNW